MVEHFDDLTGEQLAQAGGKGGTLARLHRAGYPVPPGLVILPAAFDGDDLRDAAWERVKALLAGLPSRNGRDAFAVRSSAMSEDSDRASFAGEFESVLNVQGEAAMRRAVEAVRASRLNGRVAAYSRAQGLAGEHQMAVVVQRMVEADLAGVLFTADPVTGSRASMTGNYVHGTGERLVSGDANPSTFTLSRPSGRYAGPAEMRPLARELYRLALRLEEELGGPQDIEWAVADGRLALLQARPITTLQAHNPATGEWNDSLTGDYLWSNGNFGEALPNVMTLFSWSVFRTNFRANGIDFLPGVPMGGNIGGRAYVNLSLLVSVTDALRLPRQWVRRASDEMFGRLPPQARIPTVPLSGWWVARTILPWALRRYREVAGLKKRVPAFVAETPARVDELTKKISAASSEAALLALWNSELNAQLDDAFRMLSAGTSDFKNLLRAVHAQLQRLVGDADANALMSGIDGGDLASLGPLVGLGRALRGELSREEYAHRYGHRAPDEMELSQPRPAEDPAWIERLLDEARRNPVDAATLLGRQRAAHQAAWERFAQRHGNKAPGMRRKLDRLAQASRTREATRSEFIRLIGVFRAFARRAGELTGLGGDVFLLTIEEVVGLLGGDRTPVQFIPARRETDSRYRALPPYPAFIAGRFDPQRWAAGPNRRGDWFDSQAASSGPQAEAGRVVAGFAGAAGVVEGYVRVLESPEEGSRLQAGEILVTTTTNVGWTPLFPRAAAIVTDVGAPLSHAAIVARELGIPAVVGAGNATMRLKTGDRVRVDGGRGIVEQL